jgi:hypothetical protein
MTKLVASAEIAANFGYVEEDKSDREIINTIQNFTKTIRQ